MSIQMSKQQNGDINDISDIEMQIGQENNNNTDREQQQQQQYENSIPKLKYNNSVKLEQNKNLQLQEQQKETIQLQTREDMNLQQIQNQHQTVKQDQEDEEEKQIETGQKKNIFQIPAFGMLKQKLEKTSQKIFRTNNEENNEENKTAEELKKEEKASIIGQNFSGIQKKSGFTYNFTHNSMVDPQIKTPIQSIQTYLKDNVQIYNTSSEIQKQNSTAQQTKHQKFVQSNKYFTLPESEITQNQTKPQYKVNEFAAEDINLDPLTQQMLQQIKKDGTFDVPSKQYSFPYTWRLSRWVYKGAIFRLRAFFFDYSISYRNLYFMSNRIYQGKKENTLENSLKHPQFIMGLVNILVFPIQILALIIGLPGWKTDSYKEKYHQSLEIERQKKLSEEIKKNFTQQQQEDLKAVLELIFKIGDKTKNLEQKFQASASYKSKFLYVQKFMQNQEKQIMLHATEEEIETNPDFYYNLKNKVYNEGQVQQIQKADFLNQEQKNSFCRYLRAYQIAEYLIAESVNILKGTKEQEILEKIKKNHPIRGRFPKWHGKQKDAYFEKERLNQRKLRNKKIEEQLKNEGLEHFWLLYKHYLDHESDENKQLQKQLKKDYTHPIRVRKVRRKLLCKKVIQDPQSKFYRFEKYKYYYVKSTLPFWRILMFFLRWFGWGSNTSLWLMKQAVIGQFGLKTLFTCPIYARHTKIDQKTGVVSGDMHRKKIYPVCAIFKKVMAGIKKSRDDFEKAPDKGLFPKGFTRICNLIECYIYRFLFIGIICILICMPIIILINFCICLAMAISSWVYMPVVLVFVHVFQWLFYDFDNKKSKDWLPLRQSSKCPLFVYIIDLVFMGVIQTAWSVIMFVLHIVLAILFSIWAPIRYFLRTMYDCCCLCVIKANGRVPSNDSAMAWKIKGPGIGREVFKSIEAGKAFEIIRATLEIEELDEYQKLMIDFIQKDKEQQLKVLNNVLKCLNGTYANIQEIEGQYKPIIDNLAFQIHDRKQRFPHVYNLYNVRFNQDTVDKMLPHTKTMIQNFFDKKDMHFLWDKYNIIEGDFESMNKYIWKKAFNNEEILEPIEILEERIKLVGEDAGQIGMAKRAIKGKQSLADGKTIQIEKKKQIDYKFYLDKPLQVTDLIEHILAAQNRLHVHSQWYYYKNNKLQQNFIDQNIIFYNFEYIKEQIS